MKFLICLALLFAVAQANPGLVAPLTYSAAAVPAYATYAASPYVAAPYAAYSTYAAPAVATYSHAAYSAPAVTAYSHVAAPAVYSAPVAAVAPAVYSAPVVSTLLKKNNQFKNFPLMKFKVIENKAEQAGSDVQTLTSVNSQQSINNKLYYHKMKFLICLALLFAVAQANPGLVAPLTYSAAAVPAYTTYAASPYAAAPYAAYSTYAAPAVATYSHAAYSAPAVAAYSHVAAPAVYSAPVARVAAVAPVAPVTYTAPVVSTLLKKK
ncbi:larval/pupal cuticle protein H1C-like [Anastrepha ludens]|uniref:larval/pupal cuticle protein H1C-like n=1 Tax=Anastrepha ludens TaxID=28586 RepID=UPI0023B03848|nr:larval/pupal cuticle protein H1C-like [Anastrepha ludens]